MKPLLVVLVVLCMLLCSCKSVDTTKKLHAESQPNTSSNDIVETLVDTTPLPYYCNVCEFDSFNALAESHKSGEYIDCFTKEGLSLSDSEKEKASKVPIEERIKEINSLYQNILIIPCYNNYEARVHECTKVLNTVTSNLHWPEKGKYSSFQYYVAVDIKEGVTSQLCIEQYYFGQESKEEWQEYLQENEPMNSLLIGDREIPCVYISWENAVCFYFDMENIIVKVEEVDYDFWKLKKHHQEPVYTAIDLQKVTEKESLFSFKLIDLESVNTIDCN